MTLNGCSVFLWRLLPVLAWAQAARAGVFHGEQTPPDEPQDRPPALQIEDPYPWPGEAVALEITAEDPAQIRSCVWSVETTAGPDPTLLDDELRASLTLEEGSRAIVRVTVGLTNGISHDLSVRTAAATQVEVNEGDDLTTAIANADEGARLLLGEGEWAIDTLWLERSVRLIGQGAWLSRIEATGPYGIVADGVFASLEGLTLASETNTTLLLARDSVVEIQRARLIGGTLGMQVERSFVTLDNTAVLGASATLQSTNANVALNYSVLGWPAIAGGAAFAGGNTTMSLRGSVIGWPEANWPLLFCSNGCIISADNSLLAIAEPQDTGAAPAPDRPSGLESTDIIEGIPGFLRQPDETTLPDLADLRLLDGAAAVDAGPPDDLDPDGGPADMGIFGGPLGDWPDVDNDRDGFTNVEGDCDDLDPASIPNPTAPRPCEPTGCACRTGGSTGGLWVALLALGIRRADRRRRR